MIKKIISLGIVLVVSIELFSACSEISYNVGFEGKGMFGRKYLDEDKETSQWHLSTIVYSLGEMKALCEEWNNSAYQESDQNFSIEQNKKIREYNEAYFKNKAVIICSSWFGGEDKIPKISGVKVEGTQLIINIHYKYIHLGEMVNSVAYFWLFLIEVKKADIAGVTNMLIKDKDREQNWQL